MASLEPKLLRVNFSSVIPQGITILWSRVDEIKSERINQSMNEWKGFFKIRKNHSFKIFFFTGQLLDKIFQRHLYVNEPSELLYAFFDFMTELSSFYER